MEREELLLLLPEVEGEVEEEVAAGASSDAEEGSLRFFAESATASIELIGRRYDLEIWKYRARAPGET